MVRRTKEDSLATRDSLIDAAEMVFSDKGVSRASLSDIAQAAGMTRGAIYWHFSDKADLFSAMMDRATLPLESQRVEVGSRSGVEPLETLRRALVHVLKGVASDARTRRVFEIALYKVEYVGELTSVRDRHIAAAEQFTRRLESGIELAAEFGNVTLPMSAHEAAIGLQSLIDGLIRRWILDNSSVSLVTVGRITTDAFLCGLGFPLSTHVGRTIPSG